MIEDNEDVFARVEFLRHCKRHAAHNESSMVRKSIENLDGDAERERTVQDQAP